MAITKRLTKGSTLTHQEMDTNLDEMVGSVDSLTALKAYPLTGVVDNELLYMKGYTTVGDGGGGVFYWDSSDLSTEVTADTQSGIYVAPDSDTTGASGAWVREYSGAVNVKWFGVKGDGSTDDSGALNACPDMSYITPGTYKIDSDVDTLLWTDGVVSFTGAGAAQVQKRSLPVVPNSTHDMSTEGIAFALSKTKEATHRFTSNIIDGVVYDHFGLIDLLPDGEVIALFRRGTSHEDDAGDLVYAKTTDGKWGTVTTIADDSTYDLRSGAGGVLSNGRVVAVTGVRTPAASDWPGLRVYISYDYGENWELKQEITNPVPAAAYNSYGKGAILNGKYSIPYYGTNGSGVYFIRLLQTSDGGETWTEGPYITNVFASTYNEGWILPLGDAYVLCVCRIGSGAGGNFVQFLSDDHGETWTEVGNIVGTSGHTTNTVVSPSLEYVTSRNGTPYVLLFYTDRTTNTSHYRYCSVKDIIAGTLTGWSDDRFQTYSAPNLSGYQNTIVLDNNRVIGNLWRETTLDTVATGYQFEVALQDLPDFDSGWQSAATATTYVETHGLGRVPDRVVLEFVETLGSTVYHNNTSQVWSGSTNQGVGAVVSYTDTVLVIRTGNFALVYGAVFGSPVLSNITSGYYRIKAWL